MWDASPLRGLAQLAVALFAVGLVAWLLYRRRHTVAPRNEAMPFLEHLEEFRTRILRSGAMVLLWMLLFLSMRSERLTLGAWHLAYPEPSLYDNMAAQVYNWIARTTVPPHVTLIVASPMEAVGAQMQVALVLALLVGLPFVLYEAWAFLSPGLRAQEQRLVRASLPLALALFALGGAFGFLVVAPLLLSVLYGFAAPLGATSFLNVGMLVGTVATMVLLFGAAFELPLVMVGLVRLRILTTRTYIRRWRHATMAIFVVAALASDPTVTSQLIIGCLLLVLYWSGVLGSYLVESALASRASALTPSKAT